MPHGYPPKLVLGENKPEGKREMREKERKKERKKGRVTSQRKEHTLTYVPLTLCSSLCGKENPHGQRFGDLWRFC